MQRSAQQLAQQLRTRQISTETCFSALASFAAARSLQDLQRPHEASSSSTSSSSNWLDVFLLADGGFANEDLLFVRSKAMFKPLCEAIANVVRLLSAEMPATLLQLVSSCPKRPFLAAVLGQPAVLAYAKLLNHCMQGRHPWQPFPAALSCSLVPASGSFHGHGLRHRPCQQCLECGMPAGPG
jgi:hypothetical protein